MTSLIKGYEYDIFISYRQKDNKYDGWVTVFVENLKRELEATFKEDLSIYFDENPHDGLLENYVVDKSLETKLKSVVLIPIISQTYCDPKSFAWQSEFVAFNKMAGQDELGRDVKLPGGNVCSRIIPVRIHDLDPTDTELVENELGSRLRSIDFIYSSAGVNRPLTPQDNPDKNLNRTYYRDQINKVANAVKEVIYGLHPDEKKRITKTYQTRAQAGYATEPARAAGEKDYTPGRNMGKTVFYIAAAVLVILALAIAIPKLIHGGGGQGKGGETSGNTIAVLPVSNFTGNPELDWIADMIQSDLTAQMQGIGNLTVRPRQTTLQFRDSEEPLQTIATKMNVKDLVEASLKGSEDDLQLEIMVVEAYPEEKYIYQASFGLNFSELTDIYKDITNRMLRGMNVDPTANEENIIRERSVDPAVRRACARGNYYINQMTEEGFQKGVAYYKEAIEIDPANPEPYIGLAIGYGSGGHGAGLASLEEAKAYALKAIELDPEELNPYLANAHDMLAEWYLYREFDFDAAEHHLQRALALNPNSAPAHYTQGWYLSLVHQIDEGIAEMNRAVEIDPLNQTCLGYQAWFCQFFGRYDEALKYVQDLYEVNPQSPLADYILGTVYAFQGRYEIAIDTLQKEYSPQSSFACGLGVAYALAGQREKAIEIANEIEAQDMTWHLWSLTEIYYALGDYTRAMDFAEEAYRQRHDFIPWLVTAPYYNKMAGDPRYQEIRNNLDLPEAALRIQ